MPKQSNHPFYCYLKKCRKTAWETPEYLSIDDWIIVVQLIDILDSENGNKLWKFITQDASRARIMFDRILGWPEGYVYCFQSEEYTTLSALPGLRKWDLKQLKSALKKFHSKKKT